MSLILRLVINAAALWIAAYILPGIEVSPQPLDLLIVALIFGLINALIRPIVNFFTCPIHILTLGLFTFVVNALMLMLTGYVVGGRMDVNGFFPALLGGIIISIVSTLLSMFLLDGD